ncbi:hypothetical protein Xcel_3193 [Xylanimonas cellulosilytica DSM 15894]|uniref:Uncharacterized protein n=1 Tax=Xylanimonas cellulosilytica (strain DSM 15894 / JCM 12276 / CECT 5975 / KCTC 9989 / LMG 20990 / NBRC 107835 / XIL07) TaxID=446471 RepID=D1C0J0_XYLCX|nr:hypothetical protein [Xylanimonas cellulosilytica]ACZ32193.1 hypothetical protein Xcel_3193 [Xylanimonas cellulosilytica DSM 15894]
MDTIELRQPPAVPAFLISSGVVLGGALGWFGPALARGLAGLIERTPFPVHGLIRLVGGLDPAWSLAVLGGAGLLGGILLALSAAHEAPVLDVARDHLEHRHGTREQWVDRAEAASAFRDGRDLVLLRPDGGLRARLDVDDLSAEQVRDALTTQGWAVLDADPFEAAFEPWADGRPGFTAEENTLLRRRREARTDAAALRTVDEQLAESGLVVRVRRDRLQVRRVRRVRGAA